MIVCNVSGRLTMATRNWSVNGSYTRSRQIKIAREISLRTQHRLISVSPRNIFCIDYASASSIASLLLSDCYTCIKTWGESYTLCSTIKTRCHALKTRCHAGIWEIYRLIHILAWIYRSCIVIHKVSVLDGSLQYVYCVPYMAILQIFLLFSMTWYVYFNRLPCSNDKMYNDHVFAYRFLLQMTTFVKCTLIWVSLLLHAIIAYAIVFAKITT